MIRNSHLILLLLCIGCTNTNSCTSSPVKNQPKDQASTSSKEHTVETADEPEAVIVNEVTLVSTVKVLHAKKYLQLTDSVNLKLTQIENLKEEKGTGKTTTSLYTRRQCLVPYKLTWQGGQRSAFEKALYKNNASVLSWLKNSVPKGETTHTLESSVVRLTGNTYEPIRTFTLNDLTGDYTAETPSVKSEQVDILAFTKDDHLGVIFNAQTTKLKTPYAFRLVLDEEAVAASKDVFCNELSGKKIKLNAPEPAP